MSLQNVLYFLQNAILALSHLSSTKYNEMNCDYISDECADGSCILVVVVEQPFF